MSGPGPSAPSGRTGDRPGGVRLGILTAAEQIISERGLGGATTRAIAEAAGCAEGSIYRHFPDKNALVVEVVKGRFPHFFELLCSLPGRAGTRTVEENLEAVGRIALDFYRQILPVTSGVISDRELLGRQRLSFEGSDRGPVKNYLLLVQYLEREKELGRIVPQVRCESAAKLFLGGLYGQAFMELLIGRGWDGTSTEDAELVGSLVATLMRALRPRPEDQAAAAGSHQTALANAATP
jgi:AcrR family transcriptional regulator